jgi:ATP diphosphatase
MLEALKLQQKASGVGFDWNNTASVFTKIREELVEVEAELPHNKHEAMEGEIGDLMFAIVNLARHLDIDPGNALRSCNKKFRSRFSHIEASVGSRGETIQSADLDLMEELWVEAKTQSRA